MRFSSRALRIGGLLKGDEADVERMAFVSTVILAGATFWFAPRLPMTDLPQHAAQVAVWHDLLLGESKWEPLLHINYFTPYLLGYGFALLLSFVLPVSAALKLLLALAYYGFVAACVALRERLGGDRRMDWLFIPSFFGFAYAWGFYTFLVAAPIGVLFIVLAHRYADRPAPAPGIALIFAGSILFFSHGLVFLLACGIGGAFLLLKCRPLARLPRAALPYVALGLLCLVYAAVRLRVETNPADTPLGMFWGWDLSRLNLLVYSLGRPESPSGADWSLAPLLLLMLSAPLALGARFNLRDSTALLPFLVTLLFSASLPDVAMNSSLAFERFALFALPFYALMFRAPDQPVGGVVRRLWLPLLCWTFLAVHVERLLAFAKESAAFDGVLAATQPGHRALSLILDQASVAAGNVDVYVHFPLWYQVEKGGFVDFNFAGYLPQIVRYRVDRAPATFKASSWWLFEPAEKFDWTRDQAAIYRYFFVRHTAPLPPGYFPTGRCEPVLLKSVDSWSVFENVNCHSPSPPGATP